MCMCVRSDVLFGVGGSESSSCWCSLATVVRSGRALDLSVRRSTSEVMKGVWWAIC